MSGLSDTRSVDDIRVLDADECARAVESVRALRDRWIHRNLITPFFTLGAASYLDARGNKPRYAEYAAAANPLLRERFSWLYDKVIGALGPVLDGPVALDPQHALPGFHVFEAHPIFRERTGELHCDLQYKHLDWSDRGEVDWARPLSFTLSLQLPSCGGGLNVWDLDYDETVGLGKDEIRGIFNEREQRFHPYTEGSCALHSGHLVHQIGPIPETVAGDARITLQGHALRCGGVWRLYW